MVDRRGQLFVPLCAGDSQCRAPRRRANARKACAHRQHHPQRHTRQGRIRRRENLCPRQPRQQAQSSPCRRASSLVAGKPAGRDGAGVTRECDLERARTDADDGTRRDQDIARFMGSVWISEIEINPDAGEIRIDKYVTSHDCGTILNPGLADGQIHGSFAAAIGASLYEEFSYADDGSFLSGTFADFLVATAAEMPKLDVFHPVQSPSPYTRLGAKGIAEGNQYSTPVLSRQCGCRCPRARRHLGPTQAFEGVESINGHEQPRRTPALSAEAQGSGLRGSSSISSRRPTVRLVHLVD